MTHCACFEILQLIYEFKINVKQSKLDIVIAVILAKNGTAPAKCICDHVREEILVRVKFLVLI